MTRAPAFWWLPRPTAQARLLQPLGALVGAIAAHRMARVGARIGVPVVCVGNLVAGGAGKTPTAVALARTLLAAGERPVFLTRGYRGSLGAVPVLVDPARHSAAEVGDEPLLLARVAPTIVARDRPAGAAAGVAAGASAIVMDDGLQSRTLEPDLALAVVDAGTGIGNGLCVPAGPLRAPVRAQLRHVSAVVMVGAGAVEEDVVRLAREAGIAVLRAALVPERSALEQLRGRAVLAFAGIGRPGKFFDTLAQAGIAVGEAMTFPDHHAYRPEELARLEKRAAQAGLILATTEKDSVRLPPSLPVVTVPVRLAFERPDAAAQLLTEALRPGIRTAS